MKKKYITILIIYTIGFIFSLIKFGNIKYYQYRSKKEINNIIEDISQNVVIEKQSNENITEENKNEKNKNETNKNKENKNKENNVLKDKMLTYDFNKLKQKNTDTIAWLEIEEADINYPVVQTSNNDYYLNHSFDKTKNINGWVFMNYSNDSDFKDQNTIIFAHNSLFKNIRKVYNSSKKNNFKIKIYVKDKVYTYETFSLYLTEPYDVDILERTMNDDLIKDIIKKSIYNYGVKASSQDKILTLSTCYNDRSKRIIVHAKLL